jgi:hypothetical protein
VAGAAATRHPTRAAQKEKRGKPRAVNRLDSEAHSARRRRHPSVPSYPRSARFSSQPPKPRPLSRVRKNGVRASQAPPRDPEEAPQDRPGTAPRRPGRPTRCPGTRPSGQARGPGGHAPPVGATSSRRSGRKSTKVNARIRFTAATKGPTGSLEQPSRNRPPEDGEKESPPPGRSVHS